MSHSTSQPPESTESAPAPVLLCPRCNRQVFWSRLFEAYVCPDMGHWAGPAKACKLAEQELDDSSTIRKREGR